MAIDWEFIEELEGPLVTHGYIPTNKNGAPIGQSGVTISTGIDLGQMRLTDLTKLFMGYSYYPGQLVEKLQPYLGLKTFDAVVYLTKHPLEISHTDATLLASAMYDKVLTALHMLWADHSRVNFFDLPKEVCTVLLSLAWNFGSALDEAIPITWKTFLKCGGNNQWEEAINVLDNFQSKNPELIARRKKEANYLRKLAPIN